jgi:hypothetical protein
MTFSCRQITTTLLLLLALMPFSQAREADGRLGLIQAPHNGAPVILQPGETFEATLQSRATLQLVSETAYPLEVQWTKLPSGMEKAVCALPTDIAPGTFALEARSEQGTDRNVRAVFVYSAFPKDYTFAVVHNLAARAQPEVAFKALAAQDVAYVLLPGHLTNAGTIAEFQALLQLLDTCPLPTFVAPGPNDQQEENYEAFFGSANYRATFGLDGLIAFDPSPASPAAQWQLDQGTQHQDRRFLRPSRWTICLTGQATEEIDMRSQLSLFIDNPVSILITGSGETAPVLMNATQTRFLNAPEDGEDQVRLYAVTESRIVQGQAETTPSRQP